MGSGSKWRGSKSRGYCSKSRGPWMIPDTFCSNEYETEVLRAFTTQQPPISPFLKITLIFLREYLVKNWFSRTKDSERVALEDERKPLLQTEITINFNHLFQRKDQIFGVVKKKTKDWLIPDGDEQVLIDLVDKAFRRVEEELKFVPANHNHLTVRSRLSVTRTCHLVQKARLYNPLVDIYRVNESEKEIQPLQSLDSKDIKSESCIICLGEFSEGDSGAVKVVRCSHEYHRDCIQKWINIGHSNCPICRDQNLLPRRRYSYTSLFW